MAMREVWYHRPYYEEVCMIRVRPLLAGIAAGFLIALAHAAAALFAWGWRSHRAAAVWASTRDESYLAPRPGFGRRN
jgi:hypothetical protein